MYHSLCEESLKIDKFNNSLDPLDDFTSSLLDISNKSIPKTSTNPKKSKPWYNDECKDAIKQRKQALSKFCRYPTKENLNKVKNFRAKARRTIKASKRKSWQSYVSNLNYKTPIKKVWDMIRKISGKSKSPSFCHLNTKRGTKATSKEEIANTLGETFLDNSSSRNYSEKFQNIKKQEEKIKLNFTSSNTEEYNSLFNITDPWVLNFPPCRGPGGSILTGNVASVVSSNCPLWEERRENTTRLPWVAARKPEEGILEVIGSLVSPDGSTRLFGLDFGVEGCP